MNFFLMKMEGNNRRITKEQKLALIQYLEEHREFAHDRFINDNGCQSLAEQWSSVARTLNSLAGASKNGENWKKAWANIRNKAKQTAQEHKAEMDRTGGGTICCTKKLTELDERIVGIKRKEAVFGYMVSDPMRASGTFPDVDLVASENEFVSQTEFLENVLIVLDEEQAPGLIGVPAAQDNTTSDPKSNMQQVRHIRKTQHLPRKRKLSLEESHSKMFELVNMKVKIMQAQLIKKRRKNQLSEKQLAIAEKQLQVNCEKVSAINNLADILKEVFQQNK